MSPGRSVLRSQGKRAAAGRKHTPESVAAEVELLACAGIDNISVDLLVGLAHQTPEGWAESLRWIGKIAPAHVSVYMLDVDDERQPRPRTTKGWEHASGRGLCRATTRSRGSTTPPSRNSAGSPSASTKSPTSPARAASPFTNLKYWRMQPYLGFGVDAHSFDGRKRWGNVTSVEEYLDRSRQGASVRATTETLDPRRLAEDRFITGLRQTAGFDAPQDELAMFEAPLARLTERGWLRREDEHRLVLTSEGLLFSNEVFAEILGGS